MREDLGVISIEDIEEVLDTVHIIDNLRDRLISLKSVIDNQEELGISDLNLEHIYEEYSMLQNRILFSCKSFYANSLAALSQYDKEYEEITNKTVGDV